MVDITRPVLRTGKTDIAGSVDVTPSGGSTGTPIVAADLVGGFATKTVSFAAGETSKPVSFGVVDDALVEGVETYRLTMSNPQPSGTLPNNPFVEGTVNDNDTAPPAGNTFGPTDGNSPAAFDTGSTKNYAQWQFKPSSQTVSLQVGGLSAASTNDILNDCWLLEQGQDTAYTVFRVSGGTKTTIRAISLAPVDGDFISFRKDDDGFVRTAVNDVVKDTSAAGGATSGTFGRVTTTFANGQVTKQVKIGPVV